jgi:excisionase family DNA binding protein
VSVTVTVLLNGAPFPVELDQAAVDAIAAALPAPTKPWPEYMGVERAAAYLDMTPEALRKLVQRRKIPFSQEGPGCRLSFARADLDEYARRHRIDPIGEVNA